MRLWGKNRASTPTSAPIVLHSNSDTSSSGRTDDDEDSNRSGYSSSFSEQVGSSTANNQHAMSPLARSGNNFILGSSRVMHSSGALVPHLPGAYGTLMPMRQPDDDGLDSRRAHSRYSSGASAANFLTANTNREVARATVNILVVGAPQVGKSLFINTFRAAVTGNLKWPKAPVGICGFYGTTSVEPFPNHPTDPSWMLIDTPGRVYDSKDEVVLEKLIQGMPWKSKLVGSKSLSPSEIKDIVPIAANQAHQCIVAIPANDLIEDLGWTSTLFMKPRFTPAVDAEAVVLNTKGLVSLLRTLLNDAPPFIVITKMDKVGGTANSSARQAILSLIGQCVPTNRVFFSSFSGDSPAFDLQRDLEVDTATRESLLRLHEEICFAVQWKRRVCDL